MKLNSPIVALLGALTVTGNAEAGDICDGPSEYCNKMKACVFNTIEENEAKDKIDAAHDCHLDLKHLLEDNLPFDDRRGSFRITKANQSQTLDITTSFTGQVLAEEDTQGMHCDINEGNKLCPTIMKCVHEGRGDYRECKQLAIDSSINIKYLQIMDNQETNQCPANIFPS